MIRTIKLAGYKYGYLFFTAAWLFTLSFLFTNYLSSFSSPEKTASKLSEYIISNEKYFEELVSDSNSIRDLVTDASSDLKTKLAKEKTSVGIFSFQYNDVGNPLSVFWNTNQMDIGPGDLLRPDGYYKVRYANGVFEYIKRTVMVKGSPYIIGMLIPLRWKYYTEFKNLPDHFAAYPQLDNVYLFSNSPEDFPVKGQKQTLFYLKKKPGATFDQPGNTSVILRVAAIILLMVFINLIAAEISRQKGFVYGFAFLFILVTAVRALSYFVPFPFDFRIFDLFSPIVYASSALLPSLGDLLVNTILLFWMVSFTKFNLYKEVKPNSGAYTKRHIIITIISFLMLPLLLFYIAGLISSITKDSQVPFEVTDFFSLDIYTVISFAIICLLLLCFYYLSQMLVFFSKRIRMAFFWRIIIIISASLFFLTFNLIGTGEIGLNFILVGWLVPAYLMHYYKDENVYVSVYDSTSFFSWSVFLVISVTALLSYHNKQKEAYKRIRIAEKIAQQTDPAGQYLLGLAMVNFSSRFFQENFQRFITESESRNLKDSIINANFSGYLKNYDTRIYTYTIDHKPLYNDDSTAHEILQSIVLTQSKVIKKYGNIYYYETAADRFSYIFEEKVISDSVRQGGFVYVVIRPKAYKEDDLAAELFRSPSSEDINSNIYAYAVYDSLKLITNSNNYTFRSNIDKKQLPQYEYAFVNNNGYSELWYNAGANKSVMVVRKNRWFIESLTFFAYLFGIYLLLTVIFHYGYAMAQSGFKREKLKTIFRFTVRNQIQLTLLAVSLVSFIIIGFATISFFVSRFKLSSEQKLADKTQIIINEVNHLAKTQQVIDGSFSLSNLGLSTELQKQLMDISETQKADITFFDLNGNMQVSTQTQLYEKQILSTRMHPEAYNALHYKHYTQFFQEENIGPVTYGNLYVPVTDPATKKLTAYLNIPNTNAQSELNKEISSFLVTLVIVIAMIFLLAGTIAFWVTKRITLSFTFIANKMKEIGFGIANQEITWKKNDELGDLVIEYNKMVRKLADNANALARSERESAWREMAKQVAHEIKNPLTPMKLSIQYLQKAIDNNAPNAKELSSQVAKTLVEQIDQLAKIAGDFSQFANIANVKNETFDVTETIASLVQLYNTSPHVNLIWTKEEGTYLVHADKIQMSRLCTNLIKNAIEASVTKFTEVAIHQQHVNGSILLSFADNGRGIPQELHSKIFAPNFTTKSSGTGLGLAICKGIAEKANGSIWFKTAENKGSTFYVSFPVAQS